MPGTNSDSRQLSDILAGFDLVGRTWCYCDLAGDGGYAVPHGDSVLFHAVLHGTVRLALPTGATIELGEGESVALLGGEAHALRVASGNGAPPLDFLRNEQQVDVPPTLAIGRGGAIAARVLSGRMQLSRCGGLDPANLPGLLRLGSAGDSAWGALLRPEALPLAGVGEGSAALLTRLAAVMIVAQLRADPRCRRLASEDARDPIAEALRLIEGNPSAEWSVARLARSVGMGRSNFAAHFTARVGRAPMEVVAERRMDHAARLLSTGKLKIAEIAELSGYGSEAAFSRRFTRNFGMTPSQMREQARAARAAPRSTRKWQPLLAGPRQAVGPDRPSPPERPASSSSPFLARSALFGARHE